MCKQFINNYNSKKTRETYSSQMNHLFKQGYLDPKMTLANIAKLNNHYCTLSIFDNHPKELFLQRESQEIKEVRYVHLQVKVLDKTEQPYLLALQSLSQPEPMILLNHYSLLNWCRSKHFISWGRRRQLRDSLKQISETFFIHWSAR